MPSSCPQIHFKNNITLPALGMGSWNMGNDPSLRKSEVNALIYGLEHGLKAVDTAEMYGHGKSESVVGEALKGRRDQAYLISKVLPSNASYHKVIEACERSLSYLKTDYLDLYLLHWCSPIPLEETIEAFEALKQRGLIKAWGVSNFDVADMKHLTHLSDQCLTNQILYNLEERGTEFDLLNYDQAQKIVTMAYSPLGQAKTLLNVPILSEIASRHETSLGQATPAQIALSWVLSRPNILAIPKAATTEHQKLNIAATEITLTKDDFSDLDKIFPPPKRKQSLAVI